MGLSRARDNLPSIDAETPQDISTDGDVLIVTPIRDKKRRREFEKALAQANQRYGRALKRLAAT